MSRAYWVSILERLATPVLSAAAESRLRRDMPVHYRLGSFEGPRDATSHFEAIARLLSGIAPWLACPGLTGDEAKLQKKLGALALQTLKSISDPASPDNLLDIATGQALVERSYLALALARGKSALWTPLDTVTQQRLLDGLEKGRSIKPPWCNWLCFAAMCEATLWDLGRTPDQLRIDVCLRSHERFYKGDGIYGDGEDFHFDYYNSFVIHPMLIEILEACQRAGDLPVIPWWDRAGFLQLDKAISRAQRYAVIQERLIAPDGSFPPVGRSLTYRMGAFQTLAMMAHRHQLPEGLAPSQVRCAMTAMTRILMEAPKTWDESGWLNIGLCGHQPGLGEPYISTGSLYICANGLLPLGLPPSDPFWSDPDLPWTSVRAFHGDDLPNDHSIF